MADIKEKNPSENVSASEDINALRKTYLKADVTWKIVSIIVFVITAVFIFLVFKRILNFELYVTSIIVLVLLAAIFTCVYMLPHFLKMNSKYKAYTTRYKELFLKPILEDAFNDGEYKDFDKISTKDITRNSMLKKAKSAIANDCIKGVYKKIPFLRYDLALRYGKKKASSNCVMIVAQANTKVKSEVQIVANNFKIGGMDYEQPESFCKILSSDSSFDSKFSVYAKDQEVGQKVLKNSFINRIEKFKAGGPFALFIDKDEVSLIIRRNKDTMEASVYTKVTKEKASKEAAEEVKIIKEWIEILDDVGY